MEKIIANNKIIKFISAFLIISIIAPTVLLSSPKKAEAAVPVVVVKASSDIWGWIVKAYTVLIEKSAAITATQQTADTALHFKDLAFYLGEQFLKAAAKRLLAKMTQATINWINSDFHGAPLFLENPSSFFRDIAKSEIRNLVDMIGYDTLRFPFGRQVALDVIDSYKRQFATNAEYTLSKVINDPELLVRYRNDFDFGGWNGFLINTQYPQNNYLGFKMMVEENLASKLEGTMAAPAEKIKEALQQGMGFLSPQTCPSNPNYNNGFNEFKRPSFQYPPFEPPPACQDCTEDQQQEAENEAFKKYNEERNAERAKWTEKNTCPGGLVNTTPGSVAASQVFTALDVPILSTMLDGALGNSLAAIFDALINHFFDKGLNALADLVNPQPSFEDNWSYNGHTLGDNDNAGADRPLDIPQNVSILVGQTTSARISGGNGDYSIESQSDESRAIAIAKINASGPSGKLTVTGVSQGTTTVTVEDSSDPIQTVLVTITVGDIGDLMVSPANILTDIGADNQVTAVISGGAGPYSMQKGPDEAIATAVVAGENLIVIGIENGRTFLEIKDSSEPKKVVRVNIVIGPDGDLLVTPQNIPIAVGQRINAKISGGNGDYSMEPQSGESRAIAIAKISPATPSILAVRGIAHGETTVVVKDSSNPGQTADVVITVGASEDLIVSPINISVDADSQITANISGGRKPYSIQKKPDKTIAEAFVAEKELIVTGINGGATFLEIKDSSRPKKVIRVNVVVNPDSLDINPPDVSVNIDEYATIDIPILDGIKPYIITHNEDRGVATAEIFILDSIRVKGIAPGRTVVTVTDSSSPAKVADIIVETIAP